MKRRERSTPQAGERDYPSDPRLTIALRIIDLCRTISERGIDPFEVEVCEFFERLSPFLDQVRSLEELYLDVDAVLGLSNVIHQQGEWVRHRSSLLYFDPLLVMLKVEALTPEELADILLKAWHPILEMERLSKTGLREAIEYWNNLPSLEERVMRLDAQEVEAGSLNATDLARLGFLTEEAFTSALEGLWSELREEGETSYWNFIDRDSYEETVRRAYMVSFLVSYGYATLRVKPLEEEITLEALHQKLEATDMVEISSIPIALSYEDWLERREGNDGGGGSRG
ncbi:MAG: hypothetical protein ACE5GD_08655 [Candidatus Geothermarchaeales archaeon]